MISVFLGDIPMGSDDLTGPTAQSMSHKSTFATYDVARGKPVIQQVGEELDTQSFDFFFSEEFCDPQAELNKLKLAFSLRSPLPLLFASGGFIGQRYIVEALDVRVQKTNRSGRVVRVEASLKLIEAPVFDLLRMLGGLARAAAPGLARSASRNPTRRR